MTTDAILIAVSFILSGTAMVLVWQTTRYARQARKSRERAEAAYEEIKRSRIRDEAAIDVVHEWQRDGEPNEYLTRVHRALRPPVSGSFKRTGTSR